MVEEKFQRLGEYLYGRPPATAKRVALNWRYVGSAYAGGTSDAEIRAAKGFNGMRDNIREIAGHECFYCKKEMAFMSAPEKTIEHRIPESCGGRTEYENMTVACEPCNNALGSYLRDTAEMDVTAIVSPEIIQCPRCGGTEIYNATLSADRNFAKRYICKACKRQWSATTGTILSSHKIAIHQYRRLVGFLCSQPMPMSLRQIAMACDIGYKSAHAIFHKMKGAIAEVGTDQCCHITLGPPPPKKKGDGFLIAACPTCYRVFVANGSKWVRTKVVAPAPGHEPDVFSAVLRSIFGGPAVKPNV